MSIGHLFDLHTEVRKLLVFIIPVHPKSSICKSDVKW